VEPRHLGLAPSMSVPAAPVVEAAIEAAPGVGLREATEDFQRRWIEACLARHGGRISRAAAEAGMDRSNFHRLARRLGVLTPGV